MSNDYNHSNGAQSQKKITVFGEGKVSAKPDMAVASVGVTNEGKELLMVQQENAKISQQIINSIKNMGIPAKDIQTEAYNINSEYDYIEGKQIFRGYRVTNILRVTIRDFNKVGAVIDSAVKAGANIVNNINFEVSMANRYYEEALKLALENAQSKAFAMADKLKVRIEPIPISINEQLSGIGSNPGPMNFKAAATLGTPIEAGENDISARIEAVFVYGE
jgi:uncharacterized protein YggE